MSDRSPYARAADQPPHGRDEPEPQPLPVAEAVSEGGWRQFVSGLGADFEFLLLAGALLALSAWFVLESGQETAGGAINAPPVAMRSTGPLLNSPAEPAFAFVGAQGLDRMLPVLKAENARDARVLAAPVATASIDQHALLAEPMFDPLGTMQISGLPAEARLSAGTALEGRSDLAAGSAGLQARDWAVSLGDLDNLIIELPRTRTTPVRATFDLRDRAGVKITSLTVEVRELPEEGAGSGPLAAPAPAVQSSKVRPAKAARPSTKSTRKVNRAPVSTTIKPIPVFPGDPPPGTRSQKAAGVAPPVAVAPLSGPLFQPDPKDSAGGGLSPDLREDPRFMTLRGLGMPPPATSPGQGASP